jgi:exonuclease III
VIAKRAQAVQIYKDERFSDHAPLVIDYRVSDRWLRTQP